MSLEERLRAATAATAGTVREIRPLDLPAQSPLDQSAPPQDMPRPRRWAMWIAPLAAAAVVAAVAIALVTIRDARDVPAVPPAPPAVSAIATTLPRYYVALNDPSGLAFEGNRADHQAPERVGLAVGDTRTGKRLMTVEPPDGLTFGGVTGAADDRTFVAAAWQFPAPVGVYTGNPAAWYLLRLAPGSRQPASLTKLSVPGQPRGTMVSGIALSPNGRELAVMFQQVYFVNRAGPITLQVYSIPSGKTLHTWTTSTRNMMGFGWYWGRYSNGSLTWLADGHTLAFVYGTLGGFNGPPFGGAFHGVTVRTLDTARPGHALVGDSKAVMSFGKSGLRCDTLQLTAGGSAVICGTYAGGTPASTAYAPKFIEYAVKTGQSRVVYQVKGAYAAGIADVLWASPDGTRLLGSVLAQKTQGRPQDGFRSVGTITKGKLKPLRFPLNAPPYAGEIAFLSIADRRGVRPRSQRLSYVAAGTPSSFSSSPWRRPSVTACTTGPCRATRHRGCPRRTCRPRRCRTPRPPPASRAAALRAACRAARRRSSPSAHRTQAAPQPG